MSEKYIKLILCPTRGCYELLEVVWDESTGHKIVQCSTCKNWFEPYIESRLKARKIKTTKKEVK